jgi:hypothetical protein
MATAAAATRATMAALVKAQQQSKLGRRKQLRGSYQGPMVQRGCGRWRQKRRGKGGSSRNSSRSRHCKTRSRMTRGQRSCSGS